MTKFLIIALATLVMMGCSSEAGAPIQPPLKEYTPYACYRIPEVDDACEAKHLSKGQAIDCDKSAPSLRQQADLQDAGCYVFSETPKTSTTIARARFCCFSMDRLRNGG